MQETTQDYSTFGEDQLHQKLPIPQKLCVQGKQAYMVCCSRNCESNPYICTHNGCQCLFKTHRQCISVGWNNLIDRVSTKRVEVTRQFYHFCTEVQNVYNEILQQVSIQKEAFLNWRQNIGLNATEKLFMEIIQKSYEEQKIKGFSTQNNTQDQGLQLNGKFISDLLQNLSRKECFYVKDKEEVRKQWGLYSQNFEKTLKKLKNLYLSPNKLKPKTVQNIQQLSKLFQKQPLKYSLLYQGTKQNFSIKKFHQKCDNVCDTLTVMKTMTGLILGGFTNLAWDSNQTGEWTDDPQKKTFTFTQVNKKLNKHVSTNKNIFKYTNWGPTFGAGTDIIVYEAGCLNENLFLERPASYGNRSFNIYTSKNPREKNLALVEVEVYELLWE